MSRYQAERLRDFPIGSDTGHGIWDFRLGAFIRSEGSVWNTWDQAKAETTAARLNAGGGLDE